jgi:hypothetical protein
VAHRIDGTSSFVHDWDFLSMPTANRYGGGGPVISNTEEPNHGTLAPFIIRYRKGVTRPETVRDVWFRWDGMGLGVVWAKPFAIHVMTWGPYPCLDPSVVRIN